MIDQLESIKERFEEVSQQIMMPEIVSDQKKYTKLSKEYKDLEKIAMNSVRDAAPFAIPSRAVSRRDGSVNFLETFLFPRPQPEYEGTGAGNERS